MSLKRKINLAQRMDEVDVYLADVANITLPSPSRAPQEPGESLVEKQAAETQELRRSINEVVDYLQVRSNTTPPAPAALARSYEFGEESGEEFIAGPGISITETTTGFIISAVPVKIDEEMDDLLRGGDHNLGSSIHADVDTDMVPVAGSSIYYDGDEWKLATSTSPKDATYSGEHTELKRAAGVTNWDRNNQGDNDGYKESVATGEAYYHGGDKVWYEYRVDKTYDSGGGLVLVSDEYKVPVTTTEDCPSIPIDGGTW